MQSNLVVVSLSAHPWKPCHSTQHYPKLKAQLTLTFYAFSSHPFPQTNPYPIQTLIRIDPNLNYTHHHHMTQWHNSRGVELPARTLQVSVWACRWRWLGRSAAGYDRLSRRCRQGGQTVNDSQRTGTVAAASNIDATLTDTTHERGRSGRYCCGRARK